MRRVLASIGIGAATVNTVFPRTGFSPGDTATARVELNGGETTQEVQGFYFALKTRSNGGGTERVIGKFTVDKTVTITPGEDRSFPVDIHFPLWTPITTGGVTVWLETGLTIDWAKDPTDEDHIEVSPGTHVTTLLAAVDDLGFTLRGAEFVDTPYLDDRPFAQRFTFEPTTGEVAVGLDSIGITTVPRAEDLRVFFKFDQADQIADAHGLDFDKQEVSITFDTDDVDMMRRRLENEVDAHANG